MSYFFAFTSLLTLIILKIEGTEVELNGPFVCLYDSTGLEIGDGDFVYPVITKKCCVGFTKNKEGDQCIPYCTACLFGQCIGPEHCKCDTGFWGPACEHSIERCDCLNQGACDPFTGICNCKNGFIGKKCESKCPDGYYGRGCRQKCQCKNHTKCREYDGYCECPPGFNGKFCQTGIKRCDCLNGGTCDPNKGICNCEKGFIGDKCESKCPDGYYGKDCSQKCNCKNQGKCREHDGYCECLPGFKGTFCEIVCPEGDFDQDCLSIQKPNPQGLTRKDKLPFIGTIILVVISIIFVGAFACVLVWYVRRNRDPKPTKARFRHEQQVETTCNNDPTNLASIQKFTSLKTTTESTGQNIYTPLHKCTPSKSTNPERSNIVYCLTDTSQNDQYVEMSNPTAAPRKEVYIDMKNPNGKLVDKSYDQFEEHVYAEILYPIASQEKEEYDHLVHLGASNSVLNEDYDQINDTQNKVQNKTKGQSLGHK